MSSPISSKSPEIIIHRPGFQHIPQYNNPYQRLEAPLPAIRQMIIADIIVILRQMIEILGRLIIILNDIISGYEEIRRLSTLPYIEKLSVSQSSDPIIIVRKPLKENDVPIRIYNVDRTNGHNHETCMCEHCVNSHYRN